MFVPSDYRIEVKPLGRDSVIIDDKQELVELGEIVSIGREANYTIPDMERGGQKYFYVQGDILAFEGWGCTKISYKGEDRWVVSADKNVILGKFTKEDVEK